MNETCGCCKGIERLTPVTRLNRPGLVALGYRVETHASFLETMKARLSNLELPAELFEAGTGPGAEPARPLLSLTTRVSSDPSIALLDAWATVADVLTFYQERIANEGFLLTATERRSILELARLVGYRLRPGVAASVFFAYTLEKDSVVEIPTGARAQSVPGPGELPQSFETSDKLLARSEWNTLQVRLTHPQTFASKAIYFKGISTKLKPNDPLLFDFRGVGQELLRVLAVTPDQASGRTKVDVRSWYSIPDVTTSAIAASSGEPFAAAPVALSDSMNNLREIIDRLKRAEGFEVNTGTQTAQRVIGRLDELAEKIESIKSNAELKQALDEALPPLRDDHRLATEGNFTKLLPWIGGIVSELEEISESLAVTGTNASKMADTELSAAVNAAATGLARFAQPVAKGPSAEARTKSSLGDVIDLVGDLEKPASQPPASSLQLGRSVAGSFSAASDALPKLLVTMRPSLRDVLYRAWENLPVSAPAPVRVYALRTRASVFGHNAPLKQITSKETGRIERYEEWTLFRDTGLQESFEINLFFSNQAPRFHGTVTLSDQAGAIGTATIPSQDIANNKTLALTIPTANETVTLTVSAFANNGATFTLNFQVRKFQVAIDWRGDGAGRHISVSSTGNNLVSLDERAAAVSVFGAGNSIMVAGAIVHPPTQVPTEDPKKVSLDASYNQILPGSWTVLDEPPQKNQTRLRPLITRIDGVSEVARADYGMAAGSTQLELADKWISPGTAPGVPADSDTFATIRGTTVFAQSELLELAEEPIEEPVCGSRLELDSLVSGLDSGRWLIVAGERSDITTQVAPEQPPSRVARAAEQIETALEIKHVGAQGTDPKTPAPKEVLPGVTSSELVMLAGVEQGYDKRLRGDKTHTTLTLSTPLAYCYKRDTMKIYGNVVKATHGETKAEVLGSGDGSRDLQQFDLRQSPLTYLSAATPAGAESTLQVRVNDLLWHETDNLVGLGAKDRRYLTSTDDKDQTTVEFGNGKYGARLPTGVENVTAVYRTGIGKPGNVKAGQITSAVTKPLGVKDVVNPLPTTGGADREDRDQARRNVPIAVMALDRLVSVQDYEDFARTYAGIAKASSARLSDGRRELVHLTIAGSDDIPIATTSDLFLNLRQALLQFGDPYQPIQVVVRKLKLLVISAKVRLMPDYLWEAVEPKIRAALLDKFSFAQRDLGQDALSSEALSVMQAQTGVAYVDLDVFDAVDEDVSPQKLAKLDLTLKLRPRIVVNKAKIARPATDPSRRILPADLAYLNPAVADTLILTELSG